MPIGVPRIIYCWGEELPPQWTDIYNFIFRRRMVFLMQYLDDELCNQICGLLINIHMEDRTKELEKKEIEKSGIFKSTSKSTKESGPNSPSSPKSPTQASSQLPGGELNKKDKLSRPPLPGGAMEDLLSSYGTSLSTGAFGEDLAIQQAYTLEQYTLQKITLEWLNWNAQFFDYSDEPYLYYLAEILSKDFNKENTGQLFYGFGLAKLKGIKQNKTNQLGSAVESLHAKLLPQPTLDAKKSNIKNNMQSMVGEVYSPLPPRVKPGGALWGGALGSLNLANLISKDTNFSINNLLPDLMAFLVPGQKKQTTPLLYESILPLGSFTAPPGFARGGKEGGGQTTPPLGAPAPTQRGRGVPKVSDLCPPGQSPGGQGNKKPGFMQSIMKLSKKPGLNKLLGILASKEFLNKNTNAIALKVLGQRNVRKEYAMDNLLRSSSQKQQKKKKALNYLDFDSTPPRELPGGATGGTFKSSRRLNSLAAGTRKQTKRALQEEESKKVFVIINSFGGSVGNGITVHDALQFIKAGSLTLGLGVAASAASLVLAGGTISERYVTEGCHVMLHQPESSINGQASDIWIDSQEIMKIRLDVAEIYSLSAHRPRHKILRDLDRDFYLTATETIHYGLADEIATNEVMHEIIEMTSKVWDYHDSKQQRLLETRNSANAVDTQTQS